MMAHPSKSPLRGRSATLFVAAAGKGQAIDIPPADEWLTPPVDHTALARMWVKTHGGGPHQSKTMMLAEFTELLAAGAADRVDDAIVRENLLGKPSIRARKAALYRLRQLYDVGENWPICIVLRQLWERDPAGRPMLALLCALARDPAFRAGAAAVLDAPLGERVAGNSFEFRGAAPRQARGENG
jgi:hypothetical protein